MVLYLLFPALIFVAGIVGSQTGNVTDGELGTYKEKLGQLGNQTFNVSIKDDSSMKPDVTSPLYNDELSELKGELGLPVNETVDVITENDECFQDQEQHHRHMHCNGSLLVEYSHKECGAEFHKSMQTISTENWCDLNYIIRPYNDMTICMEMLSSVVGCYYPNPDVQDFFLYIHSQYFQNCSETELLSDPTHEVVVILTLIPVSLIPVLVFLVVWKSKVRD